MRSAYLFAWLGTLMLVVSICQAQPPRRGDQPPRVENRFRRITRETLFRLLEMQPVRQELKLRPLQIELLGDLQADLSEQRRAVFSGSELLEIPDDHPEVEPAGQAPQDQLGALRGEVGKIRGQGEKLVAVILDADQTKRLLQLRLQDEGARAFDRPEFRAELEVTDEQFEKIRAIRQTEEGLSLSRRRRQQKMDEAVLALLGQEQQAKYKELQGEVFEFPLQLPAEFRGLRDPLDGNRPSRPAN